MSQSVSLDELYRRSSQYRLWSYTIPELEEKRRLVNEKGCSRVDERLLENKEVDPYQIEKVTVEEELELLSFHSRRLGVLSKHFNMPSQVRATAVSFLRKFYLVNSVMEYHPKLILLTCLFLAAKSENTFIGINTFCKRIPKTTPESILSLEFEVLQSLKFTLLTHHPFRPLYGFFFDIQNVLKEEYTAKQLGVAYDKARNLIDEALISDAVYHFSPPQIALACFKQIDNEMILKYLNKKFNKEVQVKKEVKFEGEVKIEGEVSEVKIEDEVKEEVETSQFDELLQTIEECENMIKGAPNPTKEEATNIDKKVQYCLNPLLILKRKRENPDTANTEDPNKKPRIQSTEPLSQNATPVPVPAPTSGSN